MRKRKVSKGSAPRRSKQDRKKNDNTNELNKSDKTGDSSSLADENSRCSLHTFDEVTIKSIRADLLAWYSTNQRQLPWRDLAKSDLEPNRKGYAVWVSEVMLQQTQVATVIKYYNIWMAKWPTVEELCRASLEEVNQVWAGLGYYSRARALHEGAQHICQHLQGQIPTDCKTLMREVKGIGRYTSAAVSSIAFGQRTGLVDGNVTRVLSRLRAIGSLVNRQSTIHHLWNLADQLVAEYRPGDFNQALMELGATVCTPRTPNCQACPLNSHCTAYSLVSKKCDSSKVSGFVSADCNLCLPQIQDIESLGVCAYPQKAAKKPPRKEDTLVLVVEDTGSTPSRILMVRRPATGLLAGLWEFPNFPLPDVSRPASIKRTLTATLGERFNVADTKDVTFAGEVLHIFSHIHNTYKVYKVPAISAELQLQQFYSEFRWLSAEDISTAAVPTAMMKVFRCAYKCNEMDASKFDRKRQKKKHIVNNKNQTFLKDFFVKKN